MRRSRSLLRTGLGLSAATALVALTLSPAFAVSPGGSPTYDINTLAGKVASVNGTAGLGIRMSAFIQQEALDPSGTPTSPTITPANVLSSSLDGTSITGPNVTVNQDTNAAPQNETAIAVDPNNPSRIVASANDYVSRTWSCTIAGTPCSALGDGYSGTYFSNDGGTTWCCTSSDPAHLGTIIPGVTRLAGGQYDAGGDPAVAFDSRGNVYYAGLGFDRLSAANTVAVNRGTFDGSGALTWGAPTFINPTTSPAVFNDKEWIAVDSNPTSPFRDRVYVTWTRFVFSAGTGNYVQSPIAFAMSTDGGHTFTTPQLISGNVLYGQGSRPVVGPDGTLYVFWDASTRHQALDSTYMVKSTDGGHSWSKPLAVSTLSDIQPLADTAFRVNSFPAAAAAPNGDLYVTWTGAVPNNGSTTSGTRACAYFIPGNDVADCHSAAVWSKSTDGGATWSTPALTFAQGNRTADGYPVSQPSASPGCTAAQGCDGSTLNAPDPLGPIEDVFPSVAIGTNGKVYLGAYRGATVSPWQTCVPGDALPEGRINCTTLGAYINNTRLDYVVADLTTSTTNTVTTQPINSRYGFGGGFFGDYTDMAVGSDGVFHALYTDTNNEQTVTWFYGLEFTPTLIHQQDVATASGNF
ncbi:MAG: sialidase family protein [Candidatus Limnocylindrales bacterium]